MKNNIHVMPVDDLRPHTESAACGCKPRVEAESGGYLVIHNAWDGREFLEDETPKERGH